MYKNFRKEIYTEKFTVSEYIHRILIVFGIFILLQGLIARKFEKWALLYQIIKNIDEIFIILCFNFIISSQLLKWKIIKTNIDFFLLLFLLIAITSSILEKVPFSIALPQLVLYMKGFLVFYIYNNLPITKVTLSKYIHTFLYIAFIIFFLGLVDLLAPNWFRSVIGNVLYVDYRLGFPSVESIFIHPGIFSWFMSFIALYCFAYFLVFQRFVILFLAFVFSFGCFLALRAKSLAGMIIGIFVGVLFTKSFTKKMKNLGLFIFIGIFIFLFTGPMICNLFQSKIDAYLRVGNPINVARNALYIFSVYIAKDYFPFGAGLGRYGSWLSRVHYSPIYEKYGLSKIYGLSKEFPNFINDTLWPMIVGEVGFIGFLVYSVIIIIFIKTINKQLNSFKNKYLIAFTKGTLMVLISNLIESIAQPVFVGPPAVYFIFGSIGICYSLKNNIVKIESKKRL